MSSFLLGKQPEWDHFGSQAEKSFGFSTGNRSGDSGSFEGIVQIFQRKHSQKSEELEGGNREAESQQSHRVSQQI